MFTEESEWDDDVNRTLRQSSPVSHQPSRGYHRRWSSPVEDVIDALQKANLSLTGPIDFEQRTHQGTFIVPFNSSKTCY